jgi:hypothetical protein
MTKRFPFPPLLLLLLPLLGRAQQVHITGRVVDAKTKEPIPFASLGLLNAGADTLANENGYFQLLEPSVFKQDSLVLMTLGYVRQALLVEHGKAVNLRIELSPRPAGLIIIDRVGPGKVTTKQILTKNDIVIDGLPGNQYAFFIGNDKRRQIRKMQSVSFYIGENGLPTASFRIHIYRADGKRHSPHTDLLNERVVITANKGGQWYTRDLSRYNIAAPREGYFVALEFEKPSNSLPQSDMHTYIPSGRIMRPAFDFKNSSLWSHSPANGWTLLPQSNSLLRYNAMVKVEVVE